MILIGICGSSSAGKGWVSARLTQNHGFRTHRFCEPIRAMMRDGLGLTDAQIEGSRRGDRMPEFGGRSPQWIAASLGRWGRALDPGIWVRRWTAGLAPEWALVVADDVRFANEAEAVRAAGGVIWEISRPGGPEDYVCPAEPDLVIHNDTSITNLLAAVDREVDLLIHGGGSTAPGARGIRAGDRT